MVVIAGALIMDWISHLEIAIVVQVDVKVHCRTQVHSWLGFTLSLSRVGCLLTMELLSFLFDSDVSFISRFILVAAAFRNWSRWMGELYLARYESVPGWPVSSATDSPTKPKKKVYKSQVYILKLSAEKFTCNFAFAGAHDKMCASTFFPRKL